MAVVELPTFDRDEMAKWYAARHLEIDADLNEVHYLPKGSPAKEIRFLEVNPRLPEMSELEPIDFGVSVEGVAGHRLVVLDVTPRQWTAIQQGTLRLPAGWELAESTTYRRAAA